MMVSPPQSPTAEPGVSKLMVPKNTVSRSMRPKCITPSVQYPLAAEAVDATLSVVVNTIPRANNKRISFKLIAFSP